MTAKKMFAERAALAFAVPAFALSLTACASGNKEPPKPIQEEKVDEAGVSKTQGPAVKEEKKGFLSGVASVLVNESGPNAGPCPNVGVLYDASRLVELKGGRRFQNVAWTGEVRGVRGLCKYSGADPITVDLEIDLAFGRGPAAEGYTKKYRYFVVVTRKDVAPIARQVFEVEADFPKSADRMAGSDKAGKIVIPRADSNVSGTNFEILVGFDLTEEQLAWNRAGNRFRVNVGDQN